jgi:hypothetical protein
MHLLEKKSAYSVYLFNVINKYTKEDKWWIINIRLTYRFDKMNL